MNGKTPSTKMCLRLSLFLVLVIGFAGCDPAPQPPVVRSQATASPSLTPPGESAQFYTIGLVKAEAAKQMGVSADEVTVVGEEARDWPDSSLGCPKPNASYAQVVTRGFLIRVEAGGKRLEYHTDLNANRIILCQEDR